MSGVRYYQLMNSIMFYTTVIAASFVLAIGLNLALDYGCNPSGVMTWEGKVCIENL